MAIKNWETIKIRYCNHAGCEVGLEVETVYPAEHLPDQPPRTGTHRCSHGTACMLYNETVCIWSGAPDYDPFQEKE